MDAKELFPRVLTARVHFGCSRTDNVVANVDVSENLKFLKV